MVAIYIKHSLVKKNRDVVQKKGETNKSLLTVVT